jgi:hypothetical protein
MPMPPNRALELPVLASVDEGFEVEPALKVENVDVLDESGSLVVDEELEDVALELALELELELELGLAVATVAVPVVLALPVSQPVRVVVAVTVADPPASRSVTVIRPVPLMIAEPAVVDTDQVKLAS